jgi:hypothetical protein
LILISFVDLLILCRRATLEMTHVPDHSSKQSPSPNGPGKVAPALHALGWKSTSLPFLNVPITFNCPADGLCPGESLQNFRTFLQVHTCN